MSEKTPVLLGMSGSLRSGSYSNAILETLGEKFAGRAELRVYDLAAIPLYNQDFEGEKRPPAVKRMLADIAEADGLVLCAPEFNHSIPGVLKNAIDWASRPPDQPFAGKPCAIIGAAAGMAGTARAQYDLRRSCVFLDMHPLNKPEVFIGQAQTKFDADGNLTDEAAKGFIRDMMAALAAWTRQVARKG
jgi:chromate reductase, NAD(P)H dehydrogenase (quinone)